MHLVSHPIAHFLSITCLLVFIGAFLMLFPFVWHISKLIHTLSHCAQYQKPLLHVCILIFSLLGSQLWACASSDTCSFTIYSGLHVDVWDRFSPQLLPLCSRQLSTQNLFSPYSCMPQSYFLIIIQCYWCDSLLYQKHSKLHFTCLLYPLSLHTLHLSLLHLCIFRVRPLPALHSILHFAQLSFSILLVRGQAP